MKIRKCGYFCLLLFLLLCSMETGAEEKREMTEPFCIESTAYWEGKVTASGAKVREGICAGRKEWRGLTCIIYADDGGEKGEYIGIYEILDTGSDSRLKDGTCIDLYMENEDDCWEWGRRKVWIQLVDAKG